MNQELKRSEKIRVKEEDLDDKGTGKYTGLEYWYEGKPFTGFVVFSYHDNGFVASEQEYVDGQTMGWAVDYHDNGKIEYESLEYGASSVVFYEYDTEGNQTDGGFVNTKALYNSVARHTGMPQVDEYGYTDE
ncbi:hypothetical protein [Tenacibaculum sp. MAR_2009_124]|uniref:hypothetical protein n=1 Tax=Tenacibaculum sp. MAR_2009_124 TaxID=1250059 RepID=UPI000B86B985|nr:hypothetical protein [Tenacibaculum sp. MAR_2009_124]